jgi:hypothetical protein
LSFKSIGNFVFQTGPCSFLYLRISPWESSICFSPLLSLILAPLLFSLLAAPSLSLSLFFSYLAFSFTGGCINSFFLLRLPSPPPAPRRQARAAGARERRLAGRGARQGPKAASAQRTGPGLQLGARQAPGGAGPGAGAGRRSAASRPAARGRGAQAGRRCVRRRGARRTPGWAQAQVERAGGGAAACGQRRVDAGSGRGSWARGSGQACKRRGLAMAQAASGSDSSRRRVSAG